MGISNFDLVQANGFIGPYTTALNAGLGGPGPLTTYRGQQSTGSIGSNIYYVNSSVAGATDSLAFGLSPAAPMASINYAVSQCVSGNGDLILVGPGHVEKVTSAGGLLLNKNGITIKAMGNPGTGRPTIQFSVSTAAQITWSGNGVTLIGFLFSNTINGLVQAVLVTGTDATLIQCEWQDGVAQNTLIAWVTTAAAVRLRFFGYRYREDKTGGGTQKTEHWRIVGGDHHWFQDIHATGDFSTAVWNNITTLTTELIFWEASLNNLNAGPKPAMAILTTSTGVARAVILVVASGSTWLTASNKLAFDGASAAMIPGGVFAHPNG